MTWWMWFALAIALALAALAAWLVSRHMGGGM